MNGNVIKKIVIRASRLLFLFIICELFAIWLNRQFPESLIWVYDFRSGFADWEYKSTLIQFACYLIIFVIIYAFYIICNRDGLSFEWHMRIGKAKRRLFIWKSHWVILFLMCTVFLGLTLSVYNGVKGFGKANLWKGSLVIGHSFGAVEGSTYTGCLEAFLYNYGGGIRTFEVDLQITRDNKVVLRHDWDQEIQEGVSTDNIPTQEQFLSIPIQGKFTPLSFRDLCLLMKEYPDIWIVTDSKYTDYDNIVKQFTIMTQTAAECGAQEVLDRFVVQIYNPDMYHAVMGVYPFKSFIFTMYQYWDGTPEQFTHICRWSVEHGIDAITMKYGQATEDILNIAQCYDRDVYVHTVNEVTEAQDFLDKGVRGIYTDYINPEDLKEGE